jgi:hypothetical protein
MSDKKIGVYLYRDGTRLLFYWLVVLIPLGYGIVHSALKSAPLFQ